VRRTFACLAVLLSACGTVGTPVAAPTPTPTPTAPTALTRAPLEACGTVKAWIAPTATTAGSVTIGSKTHTVNPGTNHGATGFVVTAGADMCLFGGLDGQPTPYHGATRVDSPFCGAVLAFTAATTSSAGSITLLHFAAVTMEMPGGTDLGRPTLGMRRCVATATAPAGDLVVTGRAAPTILDMESSLWCGVVKSYAAGATIAIGSKQWQMAAGTAYDTAGPNPPDRTAVGQRACLTAAVDDQGRITRYLTSDMPAAEGGLVTTYEPATATTPGTLVFSYKYVRSIAAGTTLEGITIGKTACVTRGVDVAGDAVITGTMACGGVGF
jgi:hypothetical protein